MLLHISTSLSKSDVTEEIVLSRLHYLTLYNKINNKTTNGRDSHYFIDEISVQVEVPPNPSNEFIPAL